MLNPFGPDFQTFTTRTMLVQCLRTAQRRNELDDTREFDGVALFRWLNQQFGLVDLARLDDALLTEALELSDRGNADLVSQPEMVVA